MSREIFFLLLLASGTSMLIFLKSSSGWIMATGCYKERADGEEVGDTEEKCITEPVRGR